MKPGNPIMLKLKLRRGVLLSAAILACGMAAVAREAPPLPVVGVIELKSQTFIYDQEFPGRVEGAQSVQVRAQVDGFLLERRYREGAWVEKGDLLFEIDDTEFRARFKLAEARREQAKAVEDKARRNFDRATELKKLDSLSEREFDTAEGAWLSAQAERAAADAALSSARLELEKTRVRAPISGYADMAFIQEGALVRAMSGADSLLTRINNTRDVRVMFQVPAARVRALQQLVLQKLARYREPVEATLLLDGDLPYDHKGALRFGSGVIDPASGNMTARAEFPNREGGLSAGQLVRIRLAALEFPDALMLPQSAVQYLRGGPVAAVVDGAGQVDFAPLSAAGPFNGHFLLEPSDKFKAGAWVIVDGLNKVRPGARVDARPYRATPNATPDAASKR
jgi:membrane fusion protein (multidrug efflux system)